MHECTFSCLYSVQACILSLERRKRELELSIHNGDFDKCQSVNLIDQCCSELDIMISKAGVDATRCEVLNKASLVNSNNYNIPLCRCESMKIFQDGLRHTVSLNGCWFTELFNIFQFKADMLNNKRIMDDLKFISDEAVNRGLQVNVSLLSAMSLYWKPMGMFRSPSEALEHIRFDLLRFKDVISGRVNVLADLLVDINAQLASVNVVKTAIHNNSTLGSLNRFEVPTESMYSSSSSNSSYSDTLNAPNSIDGCPFSNTYVYSSFSANHEFSHGLHKLVDKLRVLSSMEVDSAIWNNYA